MKKIYTLAFLFLCLLATAPSMAETSPAQINKSSDPDENSKWERHESVTKIYDAKFPKQYKYNIYPFQFNDENVAISSEIVAPIDSDVENQNKNVLIKTIQTFGDELTAGTAQRILDRDAQKYTESAKTINGTIQSNNNINYKGFLGKDIYISYPIEDKKYAFRIRIYMTNYSKVEQVLSGPAESLYAYKFEDFFDSIILYDGIGKQSTPLFPYWKDYTSPNNIFTVKLPPQNRDYVPEPPKIEAISHRENMSLEIIDPVLAQSSFYVVTAYKLDKRITPEIARNILFSNHIANRVENAGVNSLNIEHSVTDEAQVMRSKLIITPLQNRPYIDSIVFEARYIDDIIVIQEFLSSQNHSRSGLHQKLFSFMKFHPNRYKAVADPPSAPPPTVP